MATKETETEEPVIEEAEEVVEVENTDELTVWVKPNKTEVTINNHPDNIALAKELGWKPKKGK